MSKSKKQIEKDFSENELLFGKDPEHKTYLCVRSDTFFYGIVDLYKEKSTSPRFVYEDKDGVRGLTRLEFNLLIKKLQEEIEKPENIALQLLHVDDQISTFKVQFNKAERNHYVCMRQMDKISEDYALGLEMHRPLKSYEALLGKKIFNDSFITNKQNMSGIEFMELYNQAKKSISPVDQVIFELESFQDRFIDVGCRKIAEQKKGKPPFDSNQKQKED